MAVNNCLQTLSVGTTCIARRPPSVYTSQIDELSFEEGDTLYIIEKVGRDVYMGTYTGVWDMCYMYVLLSPLCVCVCVCVSSKMMGGGKLAVGRKRDLFPATIVSGTADSPSPPPPPTLTHSLSLSLSLSAVESSTESIDNPLHEAAKRGGSPCRM